MKINLVSRYKTKCGIATYTAFLAEKLKLVERIRIISIKNPAPYSPFYWFLLALKSRHDTDIIHVQFHYEVFGRKTIWVIINSIIYFFTLYLANIFKKIPIIITFHEAVEKKMNVVKYTDFIYKKADSIIVHTKYAEKAFDNRGYKKIFVIPHGVNTDPVILDENKCKKELGLEKKIVLTMYGFVHHFKNHELVFRILPKLPKNVFFLIAGGYRTEGEKPYWDYIVALSQKFPEQVKMWGYVEEKDEPVIFNATDIFLFPYKSITQSGPVAKLAGYNKPYIVSSLPGFLEINDKYSCFLVAEKDDEWTKGIEKIISNKEYKNNLVGNMKIFEKENSWIKIAKIHQHFYNIIGNKQ